MIENWVASSESLRTTALHKWQTNSKSLHKAWQNKGVISDENPHFETFENDNLRYKVLGIVYLASVSQNLRSHSIFGTLYSQDKALDAKKGVKISRLLNDTSWSQGPEWLRLLPEFGPESKNEDSPNSPDLEYRKKSNDIVQHECIIEERKSLFDISKYSNLEKVLRITTWQKQFITMLNKCNVLHGPLTSEELSEAERFWIQFEQEKFFSEELKSLKDNKKEKESPLYNCMPYLDENRLKIRRKARIL
ncbi:integrase catalytic domain-containing protein [Trichonephila clavipes]|nr:integrase catalytic domain-containing protein [Trichonephila clavipes]